MGRHAAVAGSPFTAPFGAIALDAAPAPRRRHGGSGPLTTGSLTRAGIAAALVTASAAAVAGSTGTFPALSDTDVASTGTNLLSVASPDAAAVPAPRAATVAPVSLAAAPVVSAVKSVSPAQKAAAAQAAQEKAQAKQAAAAKEKDSADAAPASLGSLGERIVAQAAQFKGVPYEWGGTTPSGFDCSGLTQYVFKKMGISLPRTAQQQYDAAEHISQSQAQPGDLVFMGSPGSIYHVAIYAGGGKMWTAPETGQTVKLGNLFGDYSFGRIR